MLTNYKMQLIILSSLCLVFFPQAILAQNLDELKLDIYPKLKNLHCDMPLDKCDCPQAREMRVYIDALIETGVSRDEIFYKVAKRFSLNTILDAQIKQKVEKRLIQEAGQIRPQIIFESNSFDFGRVSKKQGKISRIFKLSNKGNSPLTIKNVKTSCPCATVSLKVNPVRNKTPKVSALPSARISNGVNKKKTPYFGTEGAPKDWQIEIKPQQTGELELMIDLASSHVKPGKLIREASIFSNDPIYPELKVMVAAQVTD